MGYILGMCPQCNNVMSMPDDSAQVQCPTCKSVVMAAEAAALAGTADQLQQPSQPQQPGVSEPAGSPYSAAANAAGTPPTSPYGAAPSTNPYPAPPAPGTPYTTAGASSPALGGKWATNAAFTVLGIACAVALNYLISEFADNSIAGFISLAYVVFAIVYALKFYPSYFTDKPDINSNQAISFLNGFVGGIIFGLLWNHNLTTNNKGISNIVFVALIGAVFVFVLLAVIIAIAAIMV